MWSGRNFTHDFWEGGVHPTSKDGSALDNPSNSTIQVVSSLINQLTSFKGLGLEGLGFEGLGSEDLGFEGLGSEGLGFEGCLLYTSDAADE